MNENSGRPSAERRKRFYSLYLLFHCALGAGLLYYYRSPGALVLVALLFLLPGRLQQYFYRDFFRARHQVGLGKFGEAKVGFESFLADIRKRPWKKKLLWLSFGIFTTDIEAMTLNNLGLCLASEGSPKEASRCYQEAIEIDPDYPFPHFGLSLLSIQKQDFLAAARSLRTANRLGYSFSKVDAAFQTLGQRYASLQSRSLEFGRTAREESCDVAIIYEALGLFEDAIRIYDQYPQKDKDSVLYGKARCLLALREFDRLQAHLKSCTLASGDATIFQASAAYLQGDFRSAEGLLEDGERKPEYAAFLAEIHLAEGKLDQAACELKEFLADNPDHGRTLALLSQIALAEGDWEKVVELACRARECSLNPPELAVESEAIAQFEQGNLLLARLLFEEFLERAEYFRPRFYGIEEKMEKARTYLKKLSA